MSFIDDLNNLDLNNPGSWPMPAKSLAFVFVFIGVLLIGWQIDITKQRTALSDLKKKESDQIDVLDIRQKKAANIDALTEQMKEMEKSYGDLVRQLPYETEIAGLLIDISQTGLSAGLEFKLFQPLEEVQTEFYAELPIKISVIGDYHQLGRFISGIASLPTIVTAHDISIKLLGQIGDGGDNPSLVMDVVAKTYHTLGQDIE